MMSLQSPESSGGDSLPPTPIDSLMVTNSQGGYGAHLQKNNDRFTIEDEAIRAQFTPQEIRDLRMVFDTFDTDKTGCIDIVSLRRAIRTLGFKVSMKTITQMVDDLNDERSGYVTFSEFIEIVVVRQGDTRDPYDELVQGFQMMDTAKRGKLSYTDLKRAAKEAGVKFTDKEVWEMIEEADLNGDRMVNQDEFIKVMLQTNLF